jgi:hypothetical protein
MDCHMVGGSGWRFFLVPLALVLADGHEVSAESDFRRFIPNGTLNDSNTRGDGCGHCHRLPSSSSLNAFGARWSAVGWGPVLAGEDSDGDDVTNGWDLGDPQGTWESGGSDPGDPGLVTSPGQAESVPPVLSVTPLEVNHSESQGENLWETFTVENVGGDCFGNPVGACTLGVDVSTTDAWMAFDPEVADLAPLEAATVDILFTTDGLLGGLEGTATVTAPGVWNSPQDVSVVLTVPEPETSTLSAAALLLRSAMALVSQRAPGPRGRLAALSSRGFPPTSTRHSSE